VSDVEDVIRAVRAGSAGAGELYPALAAAILLFAIHGGAGNTVQPVVQSWDGADHGLVFTSPERAAVAGGLPGLAELSGRDLGARWPDGLRAAVNLGSDDVWIVLDSDAMHAIGAQPETVAAGTVVAIGAPAEAPPAELVEAVRDAVRTTAGVQAAYLYQEARPGGSSRLVAGVDLDPGLDPADVVPQLARAVAATYPAAAYLDFAALDGSLRGMVLGAVLAVR
jgi:hypothetical protein